MTIRAALKKLQIEDYGDRIFHSHSHGELFHLYDYVVLAEHLSDAAAAEFRPWFVQVVAYAEQHWRRPESVFQHIPRLLAESCQP